MKQDAYDAISTGLYQAIEDFCNNYALNSSDMLTELKNKYTKEKEKLDNTPLTKAQREQQERAVDTKYKEDKNNIHNLVRARERLIDSMLSDAATETYLKCIKDKTVRKNMGNKLWEYAYSKEHGSSYYQVFNTFVEIADVFSEAYK